jgi:hypothetical protein
MRFSNKFRSFTLPLSLTSLLFLCFAVCTVHGSNAECITEIDCLGQAANVAIAGATGTSAVQLDRQPGSLDSRAPTNAERLVKGLPLLPPTRRDSKYFLILYFLRILSLIISGHPPRVSPQSKRTVTYTGIIQVLSNGVVLGFVAPDPNYWTPLLVPDAASALQVQFTLPKRATSGSQLQLTQLVSCQYILLFSPTLNFLMLERSAGSVVWFGCRS